MQTTIKVDPIIAVLPKKFLSLSTIVTLRSETLSYKNTSQWEV